MKKSVLLSGVILLLFSTLTLAQNPGRVSIKGSIQDTSAQPAGFAIVMLLNPADSTLQNYVQTNENGAFSFNNVKNQDYLLKVSHISFLPLQLFIPAHSTSVNDLGIVRIKPIAAELMEVVIRTAKAPLTIRGDTIEYDATTFKVPPGSSVEDLLKRLPGIEVDGSGNIVAQGKDIKRLYVDGKSFFGDDPSSATKNLDAEAISKVQVFDEKSEQSQLTGVDDGSKEKAMNIELKDEYKKGSFGKATIAGGTEERWAGRGNYNRFDEKNQLSFIGYANNINETGVNWEDYSEFKGQNTFSQWDNGDFGFSSGGNRYYSFDDRDVPISYFNGMGFTRNYGAGVNYNFDNRKTKVSTSYFYNYTRLNYHTESFGQTLLTDSSYFVNDTSDHLSHKGNHSLAGRVEHDFDSLNKLVVKFNFRYTSADEVNLGEKWYYDEAMVGLNRLSNDRRKDNISYRGNATAIYNHKFKKAGRALALSAGYNLSDAGDDLTQYTGNSFLSDPVYLTLYRQLDINDNGVQQLKSSLLYTEPLSKIFFLETFYNFAWSDNEVNRQAGDPLDATVKYDSLCLWYENQVMFNRLGSGIRFAKNALNILLGVSGQHLMLDGSYARDAHLPLLTDPTHKEYWNISPKFNLNYEFSNGMWLEADYGYMINEPSFSDLQPITVITGLTSRVEGNPELNPERGHSVSLNLYYHNPASFASVNVGGDASFMDDVIGYNRSINWVDSLGYISITKPANNGKGMDVSGYLWSNFPLVKTKLTMSISANYRYDQSPAYVNEVLNQSKTSYYGGRMSFTINPYKKLTMDLYGFGRYSENQLSINNEQDQDIIAYGGGLNLKWEFVSKTYLEANFDYDFTENSRYQFTNEKPLLNASVRRLLGKKNQFQIRLAAFDILNRNFYLSQSSYQNQFYRTQAETLARYFMLSFSYNLKGFQTGVKRERFW